MSEKPSKPKRAKRPGEGRPKKITKAIAEQIQFLLAHGITEEKAAEVLGLERSTIYRAKSDPQFCNAVLESKSAANKEIVKSLYLRAIGYSHPEEKVFCSEGNIVRAETMKHYPPDVGAITLWLINCDRENWRKEIQHEENRPNNKPPMIRLFSKIDGKEAAAIRASGDQLDVLLGADFVADVKAKENGHSKQAD